MKSMLIRVVSWLIESKGAKLGAGAVGGGGVLILVLGLHSNVTGQLQIQKKEQLDFTREYVSLTIEPLKVEISNLKKDSEETKRMVRDIHQYLLKNKQ
jgi:hypothetical protein